MPVLVNKAELKFGIDTGASLTLIDETALILAGGDVAGDIPSVIFETADGRMSAAAARLEHFEALGMMHLSQMVRVVDFRGSSLFTEIDGLLGLDFFAGQKLCIDFRRSVITLS